MENLFYNQKIDYKFDLKGSNRNRYAQEGGIWLVASELIFIVEDNTLLDMNFMEKRKGVPLPLFVWPIRSSLYIGVFEDIVEYGYYQWYINSIVNECCGLFSIGWCKWRESILWFIQVDYK